MNRLLLQALLAVVLLGGSTHSYGQLAEIKPFDTATNAHAASDRLYYDAIKEHILNNDKEAEALLQRFISERPNVGAAYYELARINARSNNTDKAIQMIKKAIELDDTNKWYQELYGNALVSKNQYLQAADVFAGLAAKYKPSDEYNLKAALMYQRAGKVGKAVERLQQIVQERGPDEDVLLQIYDLQQKDKNIEGAANALQQLIDAYPKEGKYYALLAEMYDKHKMPEKALATYREAEQKLPNDISIQLGFASYYKRQQNEAQYTAYVNKAVTNNTLEPEEQLSLLVTFLQETEKDTMARRTGLDLAEKLVSQHPENASIQGVYGDLLSFNGKPEEAAEAYKKSLSIDSANLTVWQQLLYHYTDRPQADSLIKYSSKALEMFPAQAILYYLNGVGYSNKGFYTKAIKSFNVAIDYQPEQNKALLAEMYSSLADVYNSAKEYKLSDQSFEKALELAPDNATILNNYAYYLSVRNTRLDDAERYSKRSLELRPGEATFLDTYGWIFYQQGKYQKARELIQQAIDKYGGHADATLYEHLGDIYYKLNDINKAVLLWQQAKEKDPLNEQIEQKIKSKKIPD
jgi:tetratricopeptide (TPR) repeat protein